MLQRENSIIFADMKRAGDCISRALSHRVNIHNTVDHVGKTL